MEDDRLVQLALSRGYITQEQLDRAKVEQKTLADRGVDHGLYFLLQDLGFLAESQARDLRKSVSSSAIRALEVDGFVIQGRLGSGGMGDVFKAVHPDGRIAAVKLLSGKLAKTEEYVRRFLREARAMQRLQHPHIVGVLGSGESLGTRYILMDLVDGPSLKTWLIDKGRFDPGHAAILLRQMAQALGYAWQHGVLHRDVKPANILLGKPRPGQDEPFCAKLCDFGLARLGPDAGEADLSHGGLTGSGLALGTPHYMSPEQASGEHDVDQRADIYGLGATVYHALLGQTLYSGKSSAVIMYKQVTENVDLQQLRSAGIAEPLVALLGRMLEKRRSARIATWDEILSALAPLAPAGAQPAPERPAQPSPATVQTDSATPPAAAAAADPGPVRQ
ncbi:MAG: serine/threonine protein kinase, partial [Planctomycetes bacterium]|nr:serine/threonine protein kinase [Planctomycetota bacterium]